MKILFLLLVCLYHLMFSGINDLVIKGDVVRIDKNTEETVANLKILISEAESKFVTTESGAFVFRLPQGPPLDFRPGDTIRFVIIHKELAIYEPAGGKTRIPSSSKEIIRIKLLPKGSKKFYTHSQLEAFIESLIKNSQVQTNNDKVSWNLKFKEYLDLWIDEYGLDNDEAQLVFKRWIEEKKNSKESHAAGLAHFAQGNFKEAAEKFSQSAEIRERLHNKKAHSQFAQSIHKTVDERLLAGDAYSASYEFEKAMDEYRKAREVRGLSKDLFPRLWILIENKIGRGFSQLAIHTKGEQNQPRLIEAEKVLRHTLSVCSKETFPTEWAMTQNSLGIVLEIRGIRTVGKEGVKLLMEAVEAFKKAQLVYRMSGFQQKCAIQINLGNVLQELGIRTEKVRFLKEAIEIYNNTLKIFKDKQSFDWAMAQNNLGNALQELGSRTGGRDGEEFLRKAIIAYEKAIKIRVKDKTPQAWGETQNNLGNTLLELGKRKSGETLNDERKCLFERAVEAFRRALEVRKRDRHEQDWAITQHNLGIAFYLLGSCLEGIERKNSLTESVKAFRNALKVRKIDFLPQQWANTQISLGNTLMRQSEDISGDERMEILKEAAKIYTDLINMHDLTPKLRIVAFLNRGVSYQDMGEWEKAREDFSTVIEMKDAPKKMKGFAHDRLEELKLK